MTSKVEFWRQANGFPGTTAAEAERAEADGWDGLSVPDSQNLTGDPYVALALAASVTSNLLLRTGVTNSFTRHPKDTKDRPLPFATAHGGSNEREQNIKYAGPVVERFFTL